MRTIAICDDDSVQTAALKAVLKEWNSHIQIYEYRSAEQFLFSYPDKPCDLLLLDIEMGGMSGMELAGKLRSSGDKLPIIFITGYSEFMQDGFDVEALHYLLKPLNKEKLFSVLDRYESEHRADSRTIWRSGDETLCIALDDIVYLEAFGKRTQIYLSDGREILADCGLGAAAEKLGDQFMPCHRSYIVNMAYITNISRTDITLDSGRRIPLSRRMYDSVNKKFIDFYKEKA